VRHQVLHPYETVGKYSALYFNLYDFK
jgi:hypothetical protein